MSSPLELLSEAPDYSQQRARGPCRHHAGFSADLGRVFGESPAGRDPYGTGDHSLRGQTCARSPCGENC